MDETYEQALDDLLRDADATQQAGNAVARAGKRLAAAAKLGDANAIERAIGQLRDATRQAVQQSANTQDGWTFDLGAYAHSGKLKDEIFARAQVDGLRLTEQDGRIFSYPSLVRLITSPESEKCAIQVDKKTSRALRPTHVVNELRSRRDKKPGFKARDFLDALYSAYRVRESGDNSAVLLDLYDLLVLFPGQKSNYLKQEFARDIALLDASGEAETRDGRRMRLAASSGTRLHQNKVLKVIDQLGREHVYYAITFERPSA